MKKPIVWSIAGIDPTGLAGNQADLDTLRNLKISGHSVITAVTAQNSNALRNITILNNIQDQCTILATEFYPQAIKIGMLGSVKNILAVAAFLKNHKIPVILDPVLQSSSKTNLFTDNNYLENLIAFFQNVEVLTPNILEVEAILNIKIQNYIDIENAAQQFIKLGVKNIIIKGGHSQDVNYSQDYWTNGKEQFWISSPKAATKNYRGTGCVFASAIAANIAKGHSIEDSIVISKMYINHAIRRSFAISKSSQKLYHASFMQNFLDLPKISKQPILNDNLKFKKCKLELYPIVENSEWVEKLLTYGVKLLQLRIKNKSIDIVAQEIQRSVALAKRYNATIFINDHWQLAIQHQADGVHLGQQDIESADITAIYNAGLLLGISTHCYSEVAIAHNFNPSYIACGPIYPTTSKVMPFKPQGLTNLKRWRKTLKYPIVAIGGINLTNIDAICKTKVDGVALISAITQDPNPAAATHELLNKINKYAKL